LILGLFFTSGNNTNFFETLYDKYNREVYMICFLYCQNKTDAEDCLHEVFYRAMTKSNEIIKHPAPDKWLFTAARLVSLEKLRVRQKTYKRETDIKNFESVLQNGTFEDNLFERNYTDTEIILLRDDILEKLNKKEQELYILRYIDKLNVDIISKRLKISYSNTTTKLNRLKTKIIKSVNIILHEVN